MKRAVTLKENHEFRRLYQKGASAVSGCMVVYCRKNRLGHNRLGITVSVKLGHAMVRKTVSTGWKELNDTFLRLCRKLELMGEGV